MFTLQMSATGMNCSMQACWPLVNFIAITPIRATHAADAVRVAYLMNSGLIQLTE